MEERVRGDGVSGGQSDLNPRGLFKPCSLPPGRYGIDCDLGRSRSISSSGDKLSDSVRPRPASYAQLHRSIWTISALPACNIQYFRVDRAFGGTKRRISYIMLTRYRGSTETRRNIAMRRRVDGIVLQGTRRNHVTRASLCM